LNVFLCGIGIESYINFNKSIEAMITGAKNINRWILLSQEWDNSLPVKVRNGNFSILSLE